jgi:hypothetical protein
VTDSSSDSNLNSILSTALDNEPEPISSMSPAVFKII